MQSDRLKLCMSFLSLYIVFKVKKEQMLKTTVVGLMQDISVLYTVGYVSNHARVNVISNETLWTEIGVSAIIKINSSSPSGVRSHC